MGKKEHALPPMHDHDMKTLLGYTLREEHIMKLWRKFTEADDDCNGVWTAAELYGLIKEPRASMRAPVIDALFWMGDANSQGALAFVDFCVTFMAFCSLSKEEILQLLFIIIDRDRNGHIEKEELLQYFSFCPDPTVKAAPIFPLNNKNALDQFKGGRWASLEFDGLAQLCERFPYISYPAYHTQEMYRAELLGHRFWDRLDEHRSKYHRSQGKRLVKMPGMNAKVEIHMPGRCTMQELLDFSRRKTAVRGGKRIVADASKKTVSEVTAERDEEIARCPILTMIRNPRCMYYVPYSANSVDTSAYQKAQKDLELPEFSLEYQDPLEKDPGAGFVKQVKGPKMAWEDNDDSDSDYSSGSSSGED